MLMVFERQPGQLTSKGQELLDKLRESGEWCNRAAVAGLFGQKKIYPHDVALLEELVKAGLAEKRRVDKPGFIPFEWQYRAAEKK